MLLPGDCAVSCTFFLNKALRSEYPRLRDFGESGERDEVGRGGSSGERESGGLLASLSSGATSCVLIVKSGVPGRCFALPATLCSSSCAPVPTTLDLFPGPSRSTSVEKRTRGESSVGRRATAGRAEVSTAEVRDRGAESGLVFVLRVAGVRSSASCEAEWRRLMRPPPSLAPSLVPARDASGASPVADIVDSHALCLRALRPI